MSWISNRVGLVAGVLALASLGAWLADALGVGLPRTGARVLVVATCLAAAVWVGRVVVRSWREPAGEGGLRPGRILLLLVVLSLAIKLVGIDFELIDHPPNDEGVYHKVARRINEGWVVPETFNYGHFLYYAGAVVLWIRDLFPDAVPRLATALYGPAESEYALRHLLLRGFNAALAALTVVPVFWVGRRVAGVAAGALGGLLIALSPVYQQVAQIFISDVASGFFAALALGYAARLLDGETTRDYLLAGAAAGLAAASKYPGGVSTIAIVGVWIWWRLRRRDVSWSLLWAGLVSIAAFVAVMPGLVLLPEKAFAAKGYSIFFGFRQYAFGGWIGVVPESVPLWYGRLLTWNFGWPAIVAGLSGLLLLRGERRLRLLGVLAFPVAYLALIASMSMVVQRNLQPGLPAVAALLGIGAAAWIERLGRWLPGPGRRWRAAFAAAAVVVVAGVPAFRSLVWGVSHVRPGTRQLTREWLEENAPEGAGILTESHAPRLDAARYRLHYQRFAALDPLDNVLDPRWDFLVLARPVWEMFLDPSQWREPQHEILARRYRRMLELELAAEFDPGRWRAGPLLRIYRLHPETVVHRTRRAFRAADAVWLSTPDLARDGPKGSIRFRRRWHYALFKDYLAAGRYEVAWGSRPNPPEGWLYVVSRDNREVGSLEIAPDLTVELPRDDKYLIRVFLAPRTVLHGFELRRLEPGGAASRGGG